MMLAGGHLSQVDPTRGPLLHSNSSLTAFRRCPREYFFRYVLLRKPRRKTEALRFGSFFHVGLNAWWRPTEADATGRLDSARCAIEDRARSFPVDEDPFEFVKAERLLAGYSARWGDEPFRTVAVELQFKLPIEDRGRSNAWANMGGSIDAIAKRDGKVHLIEHKTTSEDIGQGSDYWKHIVALDSQVSTYMAAARALGYDPQSTVYDVIRKPTVLPAKATPEEKKKYTIPTKANPIPRLYATMREADETPEEYGDRLTADIAERPDWYFQRKTIVRLESDNEEHELDVLHTAEMIRFSHERGAWPRSPNACQRYHRLCEYHDVCSGVATITDETRFATKQRQHEELEPCT